MPYETPLNADRLIAAIREAVDAAGAHLPIHTEDRNDCDASRDTGIVAVFLPDDQHRIILLRYKSELLLPRWEIRGEKLAVGSMAAHGGADQWDAIVRLSTGEPWYMHATDAQTALADHGFRADDRNYRNLAAVPAPPLGRVFPSSD